MGTGQLLTASQEDYLEAIFHIASEKQAARAKDIARRLKVNSSSVTGALRVLAEKGLVNYAPYDVITLTAEGKEIAEDVVRRHEVLRDFFVRVLRIDPVEADEGACKAEHAFPRPILDSLIKFVEFIDVCPRVGVSWMDAFRAYCDGGLDQEECVRCTFQALEELKGKRRKDAEQGKSILTLQELEPGQRGRIVKIKARGEVRNGILDMDIRPGALVEIERLHPDTDQVEIKMRGYHLSLRKDDANKVIVELL
ncbi:MAG: metal-dependent transcriptional regulator [Deltaproteobacteria bacterium]|nr:metal-dependent transcriptional regulator [Deltaproteobacteria bacterium]